MALPLFALRAVSALSKLKGNGGGSLPFTIKVKVEGFDVIKRRLEGIPQRLRSNIMRTGMRRAMAVLRNEARERVPVATGRLRKSIKSGARVINRGESVIGTVRAGGDGARHAPLVEYGTRPHVIRARAVNIAAPGSFRAMNIRNVGIFRGAVNHPGAKPARFMRGSFEAKGGEAMNVFRNYVENRVIQYWKTGR